MIRKIYYLLILTAFLPIIITSQDFNVLKIEPPNWWSGMNLNSIQLMVYGDELKHVTVSGEQLKIKNVHYVESDSYLFVDIEIDQNIKPGDYTLTFSRNSGSIEINYPILPRNNSANIHQGFSNEDVIYLLMPDRFANGDISNDSIPGYYDKYQNIFTQSRHGGDIQGVIDHLEYLKEFGITTIWLTPLVENNTFRSYHGYGTTNFYNVDPRQGTNNLYKHFVSEAHKRDLKVILDHVSNHISIDHPWMNDLPTSDWINGSVDDHLNANHNKMVYTDIYADSSTIREVHEGWFINYMPDLNQSNPYLGNYIIQNTIWWVEFAGVDGLREDTYPYCDQEFMSKWAKVLLDEYPKLNIVGEVWTGEPAFLAGYIGNSYLPKKYNSNLPSITDFAMRDLLVNFLLNKKSLKDFYNLLAKDYLYPSPKNLVTFVDNHDLGRAMFYADSNIAKFKIAFHLLLTTRGIPQIFYGTEIGMIQNEDHGTLRKNFTGGFPDDERNAFTEEGRTDYENEIYNYLNKLLELRKKYKSLSIGELKHFPPENNVYIYFKSYGDEAVLNIVNGNDEPAQVDLSKYSHLFNGAKRLINLFDESNIDYSNDRKIVIEAMKANMYLLEK